jgi:hypothetical protein
VIVPGPTTSASVEAAEEFANVIEDVPELQSENWYPALGVAVISRLPPELTQVPNLETGDVLPPERVLDATVTRSC